MQKMFLQLDIDLEDQIIKGQTIQEFKIQAETTKIQLDIEEIKVSNVEFVKLDGEIEYEVKEYKIIFINSPDGEQLEITVNQKLQKDSRIQLKIEYETTKGGGRGITFLTKEQTRDKKQPFMYTQFEPVYARTFVPIQDSPGVKFIWEAEINVYNTETLVFMSGNEVQPDKLYFKNQIKQKQENKDIATFYFQQNQKIHSCSISLVIGYLEQQQIEKSRCYVISEPSLISLAKRKLQNLELYLKVTEDIIGEKYLWDKFRALIMPENYPFEGMEHPELNYVSNSVLYSGQTGTSAVLHDMAQTWYGVIVTAVDWRNTWLNEGFAQYIERESQVVLFESTYKDLDRVVGNNTLIEDIEFYGVDDSFTSLYPQTKGLDPTDVFTQIPVEKGYQFLYYLKSFMEVTEFQKLLKEYFITYKYQSVDYITFQNFYQDWVNDNLESKKDFLKEIDWDTWITKPGYIPKDTIKPFTSTHYNRAVQLSYKFLQFSGSAIPDDYSNFYDFNQDQKYAFIDFMLMKDNLYAATRRLCEQLDEIYDLSTDEDFNLLSRWFTLSVLLRYDQIVEQEIISFLGQTGRNELLMPVYKAYQMTNRLKKGNQLLDLYRDFYHPITIKEIEEVLGNQPLPNSQQNIKTEI